MVATGAGDVQVVFPWPPERTAALRSRFKGIARGGAPRTIGAARGAQGSFEGAF
jgi:hypothetical protein